MGEVTRCVRSCNLSAGEGGLIGGDRVDERDRKVGRDRVAVRMDVGEEIAWGA